VARGARRPTRLKGPNAHAFTDATDVVPGFSGTLNTTPASGSDVGPSSGTDFAYPFNGLALGAEHCPNAGPSCAWDPRSAFSWQPNRGHDATQLFWAVNSFHDHLAAPPIGFVASDGAFEGADPILAQSLAFEEGTAFNVEVFEDFSPPPAPGAGSATVEGVVDADGMPLAGVRVEFSPSAPTRGRRSCCWRS